MVLQVGLSSVADVVPEVYFANFPSQKFKVLGRACTVPFPPAIIYAAVSPIKAKALMFASKLYYAQASGQYTGKKCIALHWTLTVGGRR